MKLVGLTGSIGSGKTTVAKFFNELGVPIYIADVEAKKLMNTSKIIRRKIMGLFGEQAYSNNALNKTYIADAIFNNKSLLSQMNAIVHPKVKQHFEKWLKKQDAPYIIYESAILYEHNKTNNFDFIILVTAPKEVRIKRVLERDKTTRKKVMVIIDNQLEDEEKVKKSHFVIDNTNLQETCTQVKTIHNQILKAIKQM